MRSSCCFRNVYRDAPNQCQQLPPLSFEEGTDTIWGIRSGRGFGKTLAAANWLGIEACTYPSHYAVISPTHDDVRYTCFEGPTGLDACIPPQLYIDKNMSLPSRTLWNGSIIRGFAGDSPERLRGPQHAKAWCDEIASWMYPEDAWSNLMFGLRLGPLPQVVWTGTPKPKPFVRKLQKEKRSVVTVGSTYENRDNLTDIFYENVAKYEGTKIGRQELLGEVLDPEEEGFVKRSQWRIWPHDKPLPKFQFIVMSLDTAFTEETHDKKKQENDPTACSVWGLFNLKRSGKSKNWWTGPAKSKADQSNLVWPGEVPGQVITVLKYPPIEHVDCWLPVFNHIVVTDRDEHDHPCEFSNDLLVGLAWKGLSNSRVNLYVGRRSDRSFGGMGHRTAPARGAKVV